VNSLKRSSIFQSLVALVDEHHGFGVGGGRPLLLGEVCLGVVCLGIAKEGGGIN
jgi:hypothetical protein